MKSGVVDLCCKESMKGLLTANQNTLIFRSGKREEGWDYLYNQIKTEKKIDHIYMQLCKVGIITWCISHCLGLPYLAPVYITRERKCMELIDRDLGIGQNKSFLFDDKALEHTHVLGFSHSGESRMVQVEPFDFISLTPEHRCHISRYLDDNFPLTEEVFAQHPWILIDAAREQRHETAVDHMTRNWRNLMELPSKSTAPWDVRLIIPKM
jgi:hypothetical protein